MLEHPQHARESMIAPRILDCAVGGGLVEDWGQGMAGRAGADCGCSKLHHGGRIHD